MSITSRLFPRLKPSLPQNDSPSGQRQRRKQLAESQQKYRWDDNVPNVQGVPMAAAVPSSDEPSLPWLLLVAETGLKLAENLLAVKLEGTDAAESAGDDSVAKRLADVRERLAITQNLKALQHPESLEGFSRDPFLTAKSVALWHADSFEDLLGDFTSLIREFGEAFEEINQLSDYEKLFQTLPLPEIAKTFMDDDSFARYRVAGPNPMLIRGIDALPDTLPLSDAQYRSVMGADDSLDAALAEHRIYLLDFKELEFLAEEPGETDGVTKYVFAPIALFAIPKGSTRLVPVTIQCGQDPAKHPLFFPADRDSPEGWGWQMAKTVVQVAEGNYHELFVHLARTHLVLEAFAVATHRHLAEVHPINVLLVPHFIGTLFINNAAANSLIAPGGPIDHIFGAPIARTQQAAGNDRLSFDFQDNLPPVNFENRRVANPEWLPDYPYRDDALLVWDAIRQWVDDYVRVYYADNEAVTGDFELAAWSQAIIDEGKIKGFPAITRIDQLVDALAMVVFTATAQHAAVNFPQKPLMTYAPAITGAGWSDAPSRQGGHDEAEWLSMLPSTTNALEQLNVLYLLGSIHFRPLGDYRSNNFPYLPWFEDPAITQSGGPLERFQSSLQRVQNVIETRNKHRQPYPFLLPDGIPNSINI
jgi:arachidonate 15-lipoxygenase